MFHVDNYYVSFKHGIALRKVEEKEKIREATYVSIENNEKKELVGMWVIRYYKDTPNRNNARKYALDKALRNLFPGKENKEIRARFWLEYFTVMGSVK